MNSTESSIDSSPAPEAAARPARAVYRGPEFRAAMGAGRDPGPGLDPLVHPHPAAPPRFLRLVLFVVRLIVFRLFRTTVEGLENLPPAPFIIASNHQAWYDTAFILAALSAGRPGLPMVYTMARRDTVFNRGWKRWIVTRLGVFPIQPSRQGEHTELDARGVASVYQVLGRGGIVLLFPEGRYSKGRQLRPLRKGVAHFALQAGVPIVPVAIEGLDRGLRPFRAVKVSIGHPVFPDPPAWWDAGQRVQRVMDWVREAIISAFGRERVRSSGGWRRMLTGLWPGRRPSSRPALPPARQRPADPVPGAVPAAPPDD